MYTIKFCLSSSVNFGDKIFNSIRNSYTTFDSWAYKLSKLNRTCLTIIDDNTGSYAAIAILKYLPSKRAIKICTFKVANKHRHKGLASSLMCVIKAIVADEFSEYDKCYITMFLTNDTFELPKFLEHHEFTFTNVLTNGEIVYTYERPVS